MRRSEWRWSDWRWSWLDLSSIDLLPYWLVSLQKVRRKESILMKDWNAYLKWARQFNSNVKCPLIHEKINHCILWNIFKAKNFTLHLPIDTVPSVAITKNKSDIPVATNILWDTKTKMLLLLYLWFYES